jgi:hypothetical protein
MRLRKSCFGDVKSCALASSCIPEPWPLLSFAAQFLALIAAANEERHLCAVLAVSSPKTIRQDLLDISSTRQWTLGLLAVKTNQTPARG